MGRILTSVVLLLCLAVTVCSVSAIRPLATSSDVTDFDYLLHVQQWGPSFCATQRDSCKVPSSITWWTMHGMWPENNDTSYPSNCNASYPFDQNAVSPILSQLNQYWPNYLTDEGSYSFWSHEWEKHGTCAAAVLPAVNTELKFFSQALKTRIVYDIGNALSNNNISPSNYQTYTEAQIVSAIEAQYGVRPILGCDYAKSVGQNVLSEIAFCVSKSNFRAFQCDEKIYDRGLERPCTDSFIIVQPSGTAVLN